MTASPCTFEVRANEPSKYFCWVGFDRSLQTYFVYVVARGNTGQGRLGRGYQVMLWRGTSARAITTVAEVKELIAAYAELPVAVETALRAAGGERVESEERVETVAGD